jgi:hypothetical protein
MESQKAQLHLASKVVIPGAPAVPAKDGKPAVPATEPRVHEVIGMSNRVVRIRQLTPDQVTASEVNAAKMAGESATFGELRNLQMLYGAYEMVYQVSDPIDEPGKIDPKKGWKKTSFASFIDPSSDLFWGKLFTAKDSGFLKQEFRKRHELNQLEFDLLSGKATPLLPED